MPHITDTYYAYGYSITSDLPLNPFLNKSNEPSDLLITEKSDCIGQLYNFEKIFESPIKNIEGDAAIEIYKRKSCHIIRIPLSADFYLTNNTIHYSPKLRGNKDNIILCLLSDVLAIWMELQGILTLHGACVSDLDQTLILLGNSGSGKSTLAAALLKSGFTFLSDDIVPIQFSEDEFIIRPGYASMRLSPPIANLFFQSKISISHNIQNISKYIIPMGADGWKPITSSASTKLKIYILNRNCIDPQSKPYIATLDPKNALLSLLQYSFVRFSPLALGIAHLRLATLGALIRQYSVKQINYPSGLDHLSLVTDFIRTDCLSK